MIERGEIGGDRKGGWFLPPKLARTPAWGRLRGNKDCGPIAKVISLGCNDIAPETSFIHREYAVRRAVEAADLLEGVKGVVYHLGGGHP